ncbi:MAG: SMI1/KNR4 family protein [Saprospiraceae bacterium]
MEVEKIEKELAVTLPQEYLDYYASLLEQRAEEDESLEVFFRVDYWIFWELDELVEKNQSLREQGIIQSTDFAFANNEEEQLLLYQNTERNATKITHSDESHDKMFYAFSLSEFVNYSYLATLIEAIETADEEGEKVNFSKHNLSSIENCVGTMYWYALYLDTSEYDDHYSEKRNARALQIFEETAAQGHPEAASQLASHYYFQEETDVEKVIEWYTKAIENGKTEDAYELADFIIDYKLEDILKAIELLESLLTTEWYRNRALLKLSRIYMRGTGVPIDNKKGLTYVRECAEGENYNALSDLAFYHYKGMGVPQNTQLAYEYLTQAEAMVTQKTGSGMWEEFIKQLETELGKE